MWFKDVPIMSNNMNTRGHMLLIILVATLSNSISASREGFYAVAHMVNSKEAVKYAMDAGANALEFDLNFDSKTGSPTRFYHGSPCDCTCYKLLHLLPIGRSGGNLCSLSRNPCNAASEYRTMLNYLLTFPKLALIYLDCKLPDVPLDIQEKAAKNLIHLVDEYIFKKGFKGKVLIGGARDKPYLTDVSRYATLSRYESRIYLTLDWNNKGPFDSLKFLTNLSTPNVVFSDGHSFCHPRTYHTAIRTASANKVNGVISKVLVWTVDLEKSFDIYYSYGARGILTNKIGLLMTWAKENNIRLAVPGDDSLKPAWSKHIINPVCDCAYYEGGCMIAKLPPANTACRCKKNFIRTCSGYVVMCKDSTSKLCKQPGFTVHDCIEGGGNCDGYKNQKCDCSYKWRWGNGGCIISTPSPIHTACKCDERFFSCHGHVVSCRNPNASQCMIPDTSKSSCILGGGNCEGY